jgi:hypothetical protein
MPEEFDRYYASQVLHIDIDDPRLRFDYYIQLAYACRNAEQDFDAHMENKS